LFSAFVSTQKLNDSQKQKEALNYVMCLLPKPNLDTLQVLMWFLEEVAEYAGIDQDWGNKMHLDNLATVITPNILLSQRTQASGEEAFLAIQVVREILRFQHELWTLPCSIVKALASLDDERPENPKKLLDFNENNPTFQLKQQSNDIIKQYKKEILESKNLVNESRQEKGEHGTVA
jgi:hypothetical protein